MGTILSEAIGSEGAGPESYTVWLPFVVPPKRTLKLEDSNEFKLLDRTCVVRGDGPQYALLIKGFDSETAARTFLLRTCAGLIWFGLKHSTGFKFNPEPAPINLFPSPKPLKEDHPYARMSGERAWREWDGDYDPRDTVVRPEHKRLIACAPGSLSVRLSTPLVLLSESMSEGIEAGHPEAVLSNPKLRLACEVYLSSHFESTPTASFLSRIMTLEIIVDDELASDPIRGLVERFIQETQAARKEADDEAVRRELESVGSRLAYLRYRSIKSRIRHLVEQKLAGAPSIPDSAAAAKEISRLYDVRSRLVHTGEVKPDEIREGNNRLDAIVPHLLMVLFKEESLRRQGEMPANIAK